MRKLKREELIKEIKNELKNYEVKKIKRIYRDVFEEPEEEIHFEDSELTEFYKSI